MLPQDAFPLTISVEETARRLGIGRALAYQLARRGELPGVLRLGRFYRVSRRSLERALDSAVSDAEPK